MNAFYRHIVLCLVTGLVAILPVGGTIMLIVFAENALRPLVPANWYFTGLGLVAVVSFLYVLGLTLTTVVGRWFWKWFDRLLSRLPGLGMIYRTLKQIVGFEADEKGMFQSVVLVRDEAIGGVEIGLVTSVEGSDEEKQFVVFLPGSPNPSQGRLVRLPASRAIRTDWTVDQALKHLFSLGKI